MTENAEDLGQRFPAGLLDGTHLGLQVRITDGTNVIQGLLSELKHGASQISETALGSPERYALGQRWVQVEFLAYGGARVRPTAIVELSA